MIGRIVPSSSTLSREVSSSLVRDARNGNRFCGLAVMFRRLLQNNDDNDKRDDVRQILFIVLLL